MLSSVSSQYNICMKQNLCQHNLVCGHMGHPEQQQPQCMETALLIPSSHSGATSLMCFIHWMPYLDERMPCIDARYFRPFKVESDIERRDQKNGTDRDLWPKWLTTFLLPISCTCGQEAVGLKSTLKAKTIDPNRVQGPRRLHRSCKADPFKPQLYGLYRVSSMKSCGEQTDQQVN